MRSLVVFLLLLLFFEGSSKAEDLCEKRFSAASTINEAENFLQTGQKNFYRNGERPLKYAQAMFLRAYGFYKNSKEHETKAYESLTRLVSIQEKLKKPKLANCYLDTLSLYPDFFEGRATKIAYRSQPDVISRMSKVEQEHDKGKDYFIEFEYTLDKDGYAKRIKLLHSNAHKVLEKIAKEALKKSRFAKNPKAPGYPNKIRDTYKYTFKFN